MTTGTARGAAKGTAGEREGEPGIFFREEAGPAQRSMGGIMAPSAQLKPFFVHSSKAVVERKNCPMTTTLFAVSASARLCGYAVRRLRLVSIVLIICVALPTPDS